MRLRIKFLALSLIPIIILGLTMFFVAADKIESGVYDETYVGMHATTLAIRDIFETGNKGKYQLNDKGEVWKGNTLNISNSLNIVDNIKNNTGLEVTVFWGDTRILTSLVNDKGERQINTKASSEIVKEVVDKGNTYQNKNVNILGKEYVVYYTPFYQEGTKDVVGMIFLGTPQKNVTEIIDKAKLKLFEIILLVVFITIIVVFFIVNRIVSSLKKSMRLLNKISHGDLNVIVDKSLLKRKDEIGNLGKGIFSLREELYNIIRVISDKVNNLNNESIKMRNISKEVYDVMENVYSSAKGMSQSCMNQAESASEASQNVTEMGEMISNNGNQIFELHIIAKDMKNVSKEAIKQFTELNKTMKTVKEAIEFLERQAELTNNSVSQIRLVIELMTEVTSQTNILAYNARIEAARAGEYGKCFTVVANEIKQLSERSNMATKEIKEIIKGLNENSNNTMEYMENVKRITEKEEQVVYQTSQSFESVIDGIEKSVKEINSVLKNSKELENIRMDTVAMVQNSAAISQENSASVEEIISSIDSIYHRIEDISKNALFLNDLSKELEKSIRIFSI